MRLATGHPTVLAISKHWMEKYGIQLSYDGEKEWAYRNEARIERALNEMIDAGEIAKPLVTDSSFLVAIQKAGGGTVKTLRRLEDIFFRVLRGFEHGLETKNDPKQEAEESNPAYEARLKHHRAQQRMRLEIIDVLSCSIRDHKKVQMDAIRTGKALYDRQKMKSMKKAHETSKKISRMVGAGNEEINIMDAEVSEADRQHLLESD